MKMRTVGLSARQAVVLPPAPLAPAVGGNPFLGGGGEGNKKDQGLFSNRSIVTGCGSHTGSDPPGSCRRAEQASSS